MSDFEQTERHLERSIDGLRDIVNDGFKEINRKLENVVTRDLLSATVDRIDSDIHATKSSLSTVEKNVEDKLEQIDQKVESSGNRTRWVIGLAIVVAGIVSGIIFSVINLLSV